MQGRERMESGSIAMRDREKRRRLTTWKACSPRARELARRRLVNFWYSVRGPDYSSSRCSSSSVRISAKMRSVSWGPERLNQFWMVRLDQRQQPLPGDHRVYLCEEPLPPRATRKPSRATNVRHPFRTPLTSRSATRRQRQQGV
jgi:hypothetical protein